MFLEVFGPEVIYNQKVRLDKRREDIVFFFYGRQVVFEENFVNLHGVVEKHPSALLHKRVSQYGHQVGFARALLAAYKQYAGLYVGEFLGEFGEDISGRAVAGAVGFGYERVVYGAEIVKLGDKGWSSCLL